MHDMRIAAKRLRYLLELVGFCLGEVGAEAQRRARELQEVLGEIHDCDVMLERIAASREREPAGFDALAARFRAERAAAVRALSRAVGGDRASPACASGCSRTRSRHPWTMRCAHNQLR